MGPLVVVKCEVAVQPVMDRVQRAVAVRVHLLILNRSPQAFDKDVVMGPSPTVHADPNARLHQTARERRAGELRTLVRVEDRRLTPPQRLVQTVQAEPGLQGVGESPRQPLAGWFAVLSNRTGRTPNPRDGSSQWGRGPSIDSFRAGWWFDQSPAARLTRRLRSHRCGLSPVVVDNSGPVGSNPEQWRGLGVIGRAG